jgi:hypothetical protein
MELASACRQMPLPILGAASSRRARSLMMPTQASAGSTVLCVSPLLEQPSKEAEKLHGFGLVAKIPLNLALEVSGCILNFRYIVDPEIFLQPPLRLGKTKDSFQTGLSVAHSTSQTCWPPLTSWCCAAE